MKDEDEATYIYILIKTKVSIKQSIIIVKDFAGSPEVHYIQVRLYLFQNTFPNHFLTLLK